MLSIIINHLANFESVKSFCLLNDELPYYIQEGKLKICNQDFYIILSTNSSIRESIVHPVKFEIHNMYTDILRIISEAYPEQNKTYLKLGSQLIQVELTDNSLS